MIPNYNAEARMYENAYITQSKRIYTRLSNKPDQILQRYLRVLEPKGTLNSILAVLDTERQIKICCIEEILSSRNAKK